MKDIEKTTAESLRDFRLPAYREIPDMGLYLKQVVGYISSFLEPLCVASLTESMISNYVKQKLIPAPEHRLYSRDQIATLFFIAVTKTVLTMEEIRFLLKCQSATHTTDHAYESFRDDLQAVLRSKPGDADESTSLSVRDPKHASNPERMLLFDTVVTVSRRIYLGKYFHSARSFSEAEQNNGSER